jgi:hypothetical protein
VLQRSQCRRPDCQSAERRVNSQRYRLFRSNEIWNLKLEFVLGRCGKSKPKMTQHLLPDAIRFADTGPIIVLEEVLSFPTILFIKSNITNLSTVCVAPTMAELHCESKDRRLKASCTHSSPLRQCSFGKSPTSQPLAGQGCVFLVKSHKVNYGAISHKRMLTINNFSWPNNGFQAIVHNSPKRPKRRRVTRACDECRQNKVKCDGKQPCLLCISHEFGTHAQGFVFCQYICRSSAHAETRVHV